MPYGLWGMVHQGHAVAGDGRKKLFKLKLNYNTQHTTRSDNQRERDLDTAWLITKSCSYPYAIYHICTSSWYSGWGWSGRGRGGGCTQTRNKKETYALSSHLSYHHFNVICITITRLSSFYHHLHLSCRKRAGGEAGQVQGTTYIVKLKFHIDWCWCSRLKYHHLTNHNISIASS
jgi:hypothetical protein